MTLILSFRIILISTQSVLTRGLVEVPERKSKEWLQPQESVNVHKKELGHRKEEKVTVRLGRYMLIRNQGFINKLNDDCILLSWSTYSRDFCVNFYYLRLDLPTHKLRRIQMRVFRTRSSTGQNLITI